MNAQAVPVRVTIPDPFKPLLLENWRYKFYHGGRGGGKSYAFADSILMKARQRKLFVACLREIQDSIKIRFISCSVTASVIISLMIIGFMKTALTIW